MGASISTSIQGQTAPSTEMANKLSARADDDLLDLNKENIENRGQHFLPFATMSDDEDEIDYHTSLNPLGVLEERSAAGMDDDLSPVLEQHLSPTNDMSDLTVISLGSDKLPSLKLLDFESPPVTGKSMNAHGSPVSVNDACESNESVSDATPEIDAIRNNAAQNREDLAPLPAQPAAIVELVFGLSSPQSPHIALYPEVHRTVTERLQSATTSKQSSVQRYVFSQHPEIAKETSNVRGEQVKQSRNISSTVRQVPENGVDEVQVSVKRMISARLHETHAALDEVLCDAVQAFEKANKEADRVLAAVSTAKSSAREAIEVEKNNKMNQVTQDQHSHDATSASGGMKHETLTSSCGNSLNSINLSTQVVHPASTSSKTMRSDNRESEAAPTHARNQQVPSSVICHSTTSSAVKECTDSKSPMIINRATPHYRRKPPVFPRLPSSVVNRPKAEREEGDVGKSPSPTNIQDFPRRVHNDRPSEHLGAGARPRFIELPQDEALSSAGETDVEDPETAEPKAVLFPVDKQKEVARARSLGYSATRQHAVPARDSTWPMSTNRVSVDAETWDIPPASIREVDTHFVEVESRRLTNGSRFSEKEMTLGFFPERMRTDNNEKDDQWDSYLPETLMGNQFAEMGTRSRARPPSGRRRVRGMWGGTGRTREHELDSRPWDGHLPRRAKTERLHQHDSFYSTDMTEPTTMEIITAIAPVAEEDKPRRRRRIRMRRKRGGKVEQTVAEWMQKPKPIQLPRWPRELRRVQSHV